MVIMVTQQKRLNFSVLRMNISLYPILEDTIRRIGISAMHRVLKFAMLSNISLALVSIKRQSNERNTPEDCPTWRAEDKTSSIYVGN